MRNHDKKNKTAECKGCKYLMNQIRLLVTKATENDGVSAFNKWEKRFRSEKR